jgi:hypothetical protein
VTLAIWVVLGLCAYLAFACLVGFLLGRADATRPPEDLWLEHSDQAPRRVA